MDSIKLDITKSVLWGSANVSPAYHNFFLHQDENRKDVDRLIFFEWHSETYVCGLKYIAALGIMYIDYKTNSPFAQQLRDLFCDAVKYVEEEDKIFQNDNPKIPDELGGYILLTKQTNKEDNYVVQCYKNTNELFPSQSYLSNSKKIDIIALTAERINSGEVNVFDDTEVNWEEVTMFQMDNIKRLLSLVVTPFLCDTGEAISMSLSGKYDPSWPYYKPEVHSKYYEPSTNTLPEENDWDYASVIEEFVNAMKAKREKAEAFKKKLKASKGGDDKSANKVFRTEWMDRANSDVVEKVVTVRKVDWEQKNKEIESLLERIKMVMHDADERVNADLLHIEQLRKRIEELENKDSQPPKDEDADETCGKQFVFDEELTMSTSAKNRRYVLCKLTKKALGQLTIKEKRLMNYIMELPEKNKTIATNLDKIKKDGEGHLSFTEKELHRKLNEKYGFESEIE